MKFLGMSGYRIRKSILVAAATLLGSIIATLVALQLVAHGVSSNQVLFGILVGLPSLAFAAHALFQLRQQRFSLTTLFITVAISAAIIAAWTYHRPNKAHFTVHLAVVESALLDSAIVKHSSMPIENSEFRQTIIENKQDAASILNLLDHRVLGYYDEVVSTWSSDDGIRSFRSGTVPTASSILVRSMHAFRFGTRLAGGVPQIRIEGETQLSFDDGNQLKWKAIFNDRVYYHGPQPPAGVLVFFRAINDKLTCIIYCEVTK